MKHRIVLTTIFLLAYFVIYITLSIAKQQYKELNILGLKVHSEQSVIQYLDLTRLDPGKKNFKFVSKKIEQFLKKGGFTLVKIFLVEETNDKLIIFIDEGLLGRVVFRKLNSINTIRIKYDFNLKEKIYNKYTIEKEIKRLKKKYGYKNIKQSLSPATNGDTALFQLDEEFYIPGLGKTRLPFFDKYGYRYNLELEFLTNHTKKNEIGLSYGFKTSYTKGLIPRIQYYHPSFIRNNDLLTFGSSIGIFYGLDLKYNKLPGWSFMEAHSNYYFTPTMKDYFTPMITTSARYSIAARSDIGLTSYNFLILRGILAPGITLLKKLRLYAGIGSEKTYIFDQDIDETAEYHVDIEKHTVRWAVFESRIKIDTRPLTFIDTKKQIFESVFNYYLNGNTFYKINLSWKGQINFDSLVVYTYSIESGIIWDKSPFYHEYSVSSSNFKGFMGKDYHTRKMIKMANEDKISIYREIIFTGIFLDLVYFKGSDYDLSDNQYGIIGGIAGHILFLDQFEFNIYYGKDYLFSKEQSQYNLSMNARKKW